MSCIRTALSTVPLKAKSLQMFHFVNAKRTSTSADLSHETLSLFQPPFFTQGPIHMPFTQLFDSPCMGDSRVPSRAVVDSVDSRVGPVHIIDRSSPDFDFFRSHRYCGDVLELRS